MLRLIDLTNRKKGKRSVVWPVFKQVKEKCICSKVIPRRNNELNLFAHVRIQHPVNLRYGR